MKFQLINFQMKSSVLGNDEFDKIIVLSKHIPIKLIIIDLIDFHYDYTNFCHDVLLIRQPRESRLNAGKMGQILFKLRGKH